MKVMKYFAVASLALFAACNNEENPVAPESGNQPVDVVMSVALPGPGTRAAMGELQNTANDQDAASVEKLHVYLVAGEDIVLSKEFTKDTDDFTKLTSATAVGAEATTGGYKFLDVDNGVTKALVIANPQGALVDGERKTVAEIRKQQLKAQINEVIYAGSETLTTVGAEPYGVNPQEDKRTVKKAELTLTASMNRFQVTGKRPRLNNGARLGWPRMKIRERAVTKRGPLSRLMPQASTARHGTASLTLPNRPA